MKHRLIQRKHAIVPVKLLLKAFASHEVKSPELSLVLYDQRLRHDVLDWQLFARDGFPVSLCFSVFSGTLQLLPKGVFINESLLYPLDGVTRLSPVVLKMARGSRGGPSVDNEDVTL